MLATYSLTVQLVVDIMGDGYATIKLNLYSLVAKQPKAIPINTL